MTHLTLRATIKPAPKRGSGEGAATGTVYIMNYII